MPNPSLALSAWAVSHNVIPIAAPVLRSTSRIAPALPAVDRAFGATVSLKKAIPFSTASGGVWIRVMRPYIDATSQATRDTRPGRPGQVRKSLLLWPERGPQPRPTITHQASRGPDWTSRTMNVQFPARARFATTLRGGLEDDDLEATFPPGSMTVSSKVEPGQPSTNCRSLLPSALTGKDTVVSPGLEVPVANANGVPVTASTAWLKTVKDSCRSGAGIGTGAVGAA